MFAKIPALNVELFEVFNDDNLLLHDTESIEMSIFVPNLEYEDLDDLEKFATSIAYKMKKVDLSLLSEENGNNFCSSPE